MTGLVLAQPILEAVELAMDENRQRGVSLFVDTATRTAAYRQMYREFSCLTRRRRALVYALSQADDPRGISRVHPRSWFVVGAGSVSLCAQSRTRAGSEYRRLVTQARRWAAEEPGRAFTVTLYAPGGRLVDTACVQTRRAA